MRIALIYPPPWKIPNPGTAPDPIDGPPADYLPGDLDTDFYQIPYGLLTLAADSIQQGHSVKVLNLSNRSWTATEALMAQLDADVYGMSCWTANRRGVHLTAQLIKRLRPSSVVVIGGPHATPMAAPILQRWPEIDCVVLGEGELTFRDLLQRVERGESLAGLPGALTRNGSNIVQGSPRSAIHSLDELANVHDYFATHIVMTSRGCPWNCTFCGAETSWGRGFRSLSVPRVLDTLEKAVQRIRPSILLIKDDTFTANKKRVLEICRGIRERQLKFSWSCDTRVDVLDDDLLREMRLAGCERLSLGVESGSAEILRLINKRITVGQIMKSADSARRYGIKTRFYMMLGNRGETEQTFRESLQFLQRARPNSYIFSCLSIYPGTDDFTDAVKAGRVDPEAYFSGKFQELKIPFDASDADAQLMNDWFYAHRGVQQLHVPGAREFQEVLEALGDHSPAHLDLAEALIEEGHLEEAEAHLTAAESLGSPTPGLVLNARACIAAKRGNYADLKAILIRAARCDPQHYVLLKNAAATKAWFESPSGALQLECRHDFQLFERNNQPMLPGELPPNWADWNSHSTISPPMVAAGLSTLEARAHLNVMR